MIKNANDILVYSELTDESILRKKSYIEIKIDSEEISDYELNNWEVKKIFKNGSALISIKKDIGQTLVDDVWMIFYKMGFTYINKKPITFDIHNDFYNKEKTVDIVVMDDETCLLIDCVASDEFNKITSFSEKIIDMSNSFRFLCGDIREKYGDKKFKYILATYNYLLNDFDKNTIIEKKIAWFDEENVNYYNALVDHLGSAARYQLLGNLFSKSTIKGMDERIPAIEGKMGNVTYYSFLIEPERLLKIGYVLHRSKANHDQMPTYQRLIKKDRLKSIREFVNNGGYFPNSIIVSIDNKDGKLKFEKAPQNIQGAHSRVGTLFLPKEYQSAYIIDGQHRLYGYSDSKYANNDTVPVIAFVNLEKEKQVKMFMDINENQKPVSKTLRNILNIDLNWSSDNLSKRREAIILNICQNLGEKPDSPLFGRVITGEDAVTEKRCITIEYLKSALEKTKFFNKYNKKNEVIERGLLDQIESETTYNIVYKYLRDSLQVIADICEEEWNKGSQGYLTINNTMVGVIRVIGDISDIVFKIKNYDINDFNIEDLFNDTTDLLSSLAETIDGLTLEKRSEIKTAKGGSAKEISWRILQVALHLNNPTFTNDDLEKYIEENCTNYNEEGLNDILIVKERLIEILKVNITNKLDWENLYFPEDLFIKLNQKLTAQKIKNSRNGVDVNIDVWDMIEFDDIPKILNYKSNWSMIFKNVFSNIEFNYSRIEIINNIKSVQNAESKINNGKQITKSEYESVNAFSLYIRGL